MRSFWSTGIVNPPLHSTTTVSPNALLVSVMKHRMWVGDGLTQKASAAPFPELCTHATMRSCGNRGLECVMVGAEVLDGLATSHAASHEQQMSAEGGTS